MPRNYRKNNSRPGDWSCGKMVYGDAQKALAIAKSVRSLINVEVKNFDFQQTLTAVNDAVGISQLSNIPQGDTTVTRDGAQIKMLGYELNYWIRRSSSSNTATLVRIMLVVDKQTNQAIYTNADLLEDATTSDNIVSPRNLDNMKRFVVLYDRVHVISATGNGGVHVKKYIKKELLIRYDGSTPSIADLTSNSLSLVQFGSETTNDPLVTIFGRLRYVDN